MRAIRRDTRLKMSHNPTGELANTLVRCLRYKKLQNKRKRLYEFNSRTTSKEL